MIPIPNEEEAGRAIQTIVDIKAENKALREALGSAPGPDYTDQVLYKTWYSGPRKDALGDGQNLAKVEVRNEN